VKTICLLRDERPFWPDISRGLESVNALLTNDISAGRPDLIITGPDTLGSLPASVEGISKLVIVGKGARTPDIKPRDIHYIEWPVSKETFLETTSRMLYIQERRVFHALISITLKGKNETYMGNSENFSISGVAFKVDAPLKTGDTVTIGFYMPNIARRINVDAEVVRATQDPSDRSAYYGAKFINMGTAEKKLLGDFIEKGR